MGIPGSAVQPVDEGNSDVIGYLAIVWESSYAGFRRRGIPLVDEYGPAQRLYGQRGYVPDGRGAWRGQRPLSKGMQVTVDDDLIIWLTKELVS